MPRWALWFAAALLTVAAQALPTPGSWADAENGTPGPVADPSGPPGSITVRKHADTLTGKLIDTARFQLWKDNGDGALQRPSTSTRATASGTASPTAAPTEKVAGPDRKVGPEESTSHGRFTWTGLGEGTYFVEETAAPSGYALPSPDRRFVPVVLAADGTAAVDFADSLVSNSIVVRKHDGTVTGPLVDTARFQLWNDVNGNGTLQPKVDTKAGPQVSTSGGTFTWTDLAVGKYLVQETTAPSGFTLPPDPVHAITIATSATGQIVTLDIADAKASASGDSVGLGDDDPPAFALMSAPGGAGPGPVALPGSGSPAVLGLAALLGLVCLA